MTAIVECESRFRQYRDGKVLISDLGTDDRGLFQINADYWLDDSKKLGYNIHTAEGNVLMAKHILKVQGLTAWNPSRNCWSPIVAKI